MTTNIDAITQQLNDADVYIVGVSAFWKKSWQQFFGRYQPTFVTKPEQVPENTTALIWSAHTELSAFKRGVKVIRVEDGFVRSVGLGAEFSRPCSWVVDSRGLYYDARQPSDLEHLLQTKQFSQQEQQRAGSVLALLKQRNISKYNVGRVTAEQPLSNIKASQQRVLVPGQVEDDASIQYGSPHIKTNLGLLQQVREQNPDAYIIYKPHPDVVAGARKQGHNEQQASKYCDAVITDAPIEYVLEQVDEVHTMTSLTGFEALVRGLKVTCYGQPFYSGWGLTYDINPNERRTTQRTLNELVHAALIDYAWYVQPIGGNAASIEDIIEWLAKQKQRQTLPTKLLTRSKKLLRRTINRLRTS